MNTLWKGFKMKMKLEEEFKTTALKHKASLVMRSLRDFYADMYDAGGEFRNEVISEKSAEHFLKIFINEKEFEKIYEACWKKYNE